MVGCLGFVVCFCCSCVVVRCGLLFDWLWLCVIVFLFMVCCLWCFLRVVFVVRCLLFDGCSSLVLFVAYFLLNGGCCL